MDNTWKGFWGARPLHQKVTAVVGVGLAVFQIYTAVFGSLDALMQRGVHLCLGLVLVYLVYPARKSGKNQLKPGWQDWLLCAFTVAVIGYLLVRYDWVTVERFTLITPMTWFEITLGLAAIVLVLEAGRRVVSPGLFWVVIAFLAYPFVGRYLPGALHTAPLNWTELVDFNYLSLGGIFGIPLGVSATEIALFIIFGAILMRSGGSYLISNFASVLAGRMVGGPAKVAVVGSSLMGTISGSGTANVATVGSVTIPMMKKAGYSANFAAAVEAVASTGGQLMPPVMGAAAFVMSAFSGIPYSTIILYAVFPAVLYYLSLFFTVDLEARRLKLSNLPPETTLKETIRNYGHMTIPVAVLIYLLVSGYTPRLAGGCGCVTALIACQLRPNTRLSLPGMLGALEDGAKGMLIVVTSTAAAGLIVGSVDLSGLGQRLCSAFIGLAGGNLLVGLFLGMAIALLLGLGMPTTPAYIVQAATVIPALISLGLPVYVAHLFAFYYSCLAIITPPDASAAYAAAALAGGDGWKTGWLATRLGLVAYIVPFMFAYDQSLLLVGPWWEAAETVVTAVLGVWCLAVAAEGFLLRKLSRFEQILAGIAALLLMAPVTSLALPGGIAMAWLLASQRRKYVKSLNNK